MKAIITVGISASGKSTWATEYAKANKALVTCRDDLRFILTGYTDWGNYKFNRKIEKVITTVQQEIVRQAFFADKDIVIADTNLNPDRRRDWIEFFNKSIPYEFKDFPITLEEAWKRDGLRANGVGRDVIYKQWQQWLVYTNRKKYSPDITKPCAIMFDIDGTLAHMDGRGPYDWERVGEDSVDTVVREMLWDFQRRGYAIILVSGRDGVCREKTYQWCVDNGIIYNELYMREVDDCRKDTVIKEEIFWQYCAQHYNVVAVVDDRPCVVRMWHDIGIEKVIAVGNQSVEF